MKPVLNTDENGNILPIKDQFGNEILPHDVDGNLIQLKDNDSDKYKKNLANALFGLIPNIPEK